MKLMDEITVSTRYLQPLKAQTKKDLKPGPYMLYMVGHGEPP